MAVIRMRNVKKAFGPVQALDGVDLEVGRGDVFGFIGPNGAGKTTTIRVLLGLLRADGGSTHVFGTDPWRDAVDIHRRVAYVPGDVDLWPQLTGGEVVDLLLRLRSVDGRGRREELVRRFDLDVTKKCGTYSKGNRQKVALVAAFASQAELFILDEPTSGLDPLMERAFQRCIDEVRDRGKTVLLSSHILSEVERLCDKVAIIRRGRIVESGPLTALRHLTRTTVHVQTRRPLPDLAATAGVHDARPTEGGWTFQADPERLSDIVRFIAEHDVVHLKASPPSLEELFMHHYENHSDHRRDHRPEHRRDHRPEHRRDHEPGHRRDHGPEHRRDHEPGHRRDHRHEHRPEHESNHGLDRRHDRRDGSEGGP